MRILVIDDNHGSLQSLCLVLSDLGHEPTPEDNPLKALELARKNFYPMIITDIRMPEMDGLDLLSALKSDPVSHESDVVLITGHADMETAVEALRRGAYDYLNKPINARELSVVVERCAEHQNLLRENRELKQDMNHKVDEVAKELKQNLDTMRTQLRNINGIGAVVAEAPSMQRIIREAMIFHSDPSVPVLLEGETGTGKEVMARLIHYGELGNDEPFMAINCAAIPHELFESELFGHEPGAFTGSRSGGAPGKLEQAGEGTLFLDEVAEMPINLQPKLLRVLEERSFYRLGGVKKREFKARIVCAGNRNMSEMVERGGFRRDLYHRLRVGHLMLPPLRERTEDLIPMAEFFLRRETERKKKHFTGFSPEAQKLLQEYSWPGNVRELENAIERAVLLNNGDLILPEYMDFLSLDRNSFSGAVLFTSPAAHGLGRRATDHIQAESFINTQHQRARADNQMENTHAVALEFPAEGLDLEAFSAEIIKKTLAQYGGNKSKTAKFLNMSRFALYRRLQKMGL